MRRRARSGPKANHRRILLRLVVHGAERVRPLVETDRRESRARLLRSQSRRRHETVYAAVAAVCLRRLAAAAGGVRLGPVVGGYGLSYQRFTSMLHRGEYRFLNAAGPDGI